jgi:Flp pilus assembly protein TadD
MLVVAVAVWCGAPVSAAYRPKYATVAHDVLRMEQRYGVPVTDEHFKQLDEILQRASVTVPFRFTNVKTNAVESCMMIDSLLVEDLKFSFENTLCFAPGLLEKKIDDAGIALIYCAVGQVLKLPVAAVETPVRCAVRWSFPDGKYFLWRVKSDAAAPKASEVDEQQLIRMDRVTPDAVRNGAYLTALSTAGLMSIHVTEAGWFRLYRGDHAAALGIAGDAVALNPRRVAAHVLKAAALYRLSRPEDALDAMSEALALDPEYYDGLIWRSDILIALKKHREALADLDLAIRTRPQLAQAHISKSVLALAMKDPAACIATVNTAVDTWGIHNTWLYNNRGFARLETGDAKRAIEDFSLALQMDAGNAKALCNRGIARQRAGDIPGANEDFAAAGMLYLRSGDREAAQDTVKRLEQNRASADLVKPLRDALSGAR